MGALGSLFGIGPAHQVQSQRGSSGFSDFGDDQMGGLMRNGSGMSRPNSYNSPGLPGMGGGMPPGMGMHPMPDGSMMPGMMGGMMGGMGGQMGQQGGMGQQRPQQYPYGITPPRGLQGQQQGQMQQQGMGGSDPLSGLLGGLLGGGGGFGGFPGGL